MGQAHGPIWKKRGVSNGEWWRSKKRGNDKVWKLPQQCRFFAGKALILSRVKIGALGLFLAGFAWAADVKTKSADLASEISGAAKIALPESFRARVTSPLVDAQLAAIPSDKKTFGLVPSLELLFKKNYGLRLITRYVDDYYVRLFAIYEPMLEQSGLFPSEEKMRRYEFAEEGTAEGNLRRIRAREKDGLAGDYALLQFGDRGLLLSTDFFEESQWTGGLKVQWESVGSNQIPVWIELKMKQGGLQKSTTVKLEDIHIGGVSASEFRGR